MENQTEKKRFPWGWVAAGCGVLVIGVVAVAAVFAFVALPAIRSAIASQSLSPNPLPAPLVSPTAVPNSNSGSGGGSSFGSLPFTFSAIQDPTALSNQSLMDQMVTSLNLNADSDFMAPKTYTGTAALDPSAGFTLGNGWCAKDATTLQQNLANMQFQFSINGTQIDLSQYPTLYFNNNQGQACAMTGILITPNGNLNGKYQVVLTQKFLNSLDDGITSSPYPAGDVTFDFSLQFLSGTPNPGTST